MGLFSLSSHAALTNDKTSGAPYATTFKITAGSKMEKKKKHLWTLELDIYVTDKMCFIARQFFPAV